MEEIVKMIHDPREAWVVMIVAIMVVAASVLSRIGLHGVAKRWQMACPWVVWLPLGDQYILGKVSDCYQKHCKGRKTHRRFTLTALGLLAPAASSVIGVLLAFLMAVFIGLVWSMGAALGNSGFRDMMLIVGVFLFGSLGILAWGGILRYMALYDLYRACFGEKGFSYLVLNILFPVVEPVVIFICRDRGEAILPHQENNSIGCEIE